MASPRGISYARARAGESPRKHGRYGQKSRIDQRKFRVFRASVVKANSQLCQRPRKSHSSCIFRCPAPIEVHEEITMSDEVRILGIAGSLRKQSFNRAALRAAVGLVPAGATLDLAEIDGLPGFNQDDEGNPPAKVLELK